MTVLLEALWPKERILTAYLNLVDWGHGNFGAEAASQSYFHKPASALTARQAARLAVILPDPAVWKAAHPGRYVAGRSDTILARMAEVTEGRPGCLCPLTSGNPRWRTAPIRLRFAKHHASSDPSPAVAAVPPRPPDHRGEAADLRSVAPEDGADYHARLHRAGRHPLRRALGDRRSSGEHIPNIPLPRRTMRPAREACAGWIGRWDRSTSR